MALLYSEGIQNRLDKTTFHRAGYPHAVQGLLVLVKTTLDRLTEAWEWLTAVLGFKSTRGLGLGLVLHCIHITGNF